MSKPNLSNRTPLRDDVSPDKLITYHRQPTLSEIKFGAGATHYRQFPQSECCHPGTRILKRWLVGSHDGLRYYR